jgi:tRNA pseudouridine55 synthase
VSHPPNHVPGNAGAAARLAGRFASLPQTYTGTLRLGATTSTYDSSGDVVDEAPWAHVTDADLAAAAEGLTGEVMQVRPATGRGLG